MDWNGKWDWDNLVSFGSKATYGPRKLGLGDVFLMDGEIDTTSPFNLSSVSDGHHASAESSTRDETPNPTFKLMISKDSARHSMKEAEVCGLGEVEPLIGLKLGKRTYFENAGPVGNDKASSSSAKLSTSNRSKSAYRSSPIPRCIVEGCALDLSTAKEYHRKHKVCDNHSKSSKVIVGGVERRFCQQCSRFHNLSEFDDKKRSCRRRLFDHNARRRKPQQESMLFSSVAPSSPFYGGREQLGFFLTNGSHISTRHCSTTKFTLSGDHSIRCEGDEGITDPMHAPVIELSNNHAMHIPTSAGLFSSKISTPGFLDSGCKESFIASPPPPHMEAATEYGRALSLLSTNNSSNSWGSCGLPAPVHCQGVMLPPAAEPRVPAMYGLGLGLAEEALPDFLLSGHHHSSAHSTQEAQDQESSSQVLRATHKPEQPGFYQNGPEMTDKTSSQFGFFY